MAKLGAVVLASGESARFEGGNKLLIPFGGKPLLAHTLAALSMDLFQKRLVVTRNPEIAALAQAHGFAALLHALPDVSDTIRLGVEQMTEMDGCLFCVGDQPLIRTETIRALASAFAQDHARIVRVRFDARLGNPALFPCSLFHELRELQGGQSGGTVMKRHSELLRTVEAGCACELEDIDTQADYERLRANTLSHKERD